TMSIIAKIAEIENEMARTQRNKATAHHLGLLKARLAKLRRELITPKGGSGGGTGEGTIMMLLTVLSCALCHACAFCPV
uniref:Developmentally regulated GTP binding protein 1 n=1 Tax=Amphiprion percula TaxID=161767 RepID=A0A3P8SKA1_AMPPE